MNFSLNYTSKTSELILLLMENAFLHNKFEIKNHFDSLIDFEEEENVNNILDRFNKSDFLRKKDVFKRFLFELFDKQSFLFIKI